MRGVDEVAKVYTVLKENCEDIGVDAKEINEKEHRQKKQK